MPDDVSASNIEEKRSEPRNILDQPYSVEINLGRPVPIYQLKLCDISGHGSCILVQENSSILNHLTVGQHLKMKFWTDSRAQPMGYFRAEVIHISKPEGDQYKNHYFIGLHIREKHEFVLEKAGSGSIKENGDIIHNVNRRQGTDRRKRKNSDYVQERRSGQDRRSGIDRRSGVDRRSGLDRRNKRNF